MLREVVHDRDANSFTKEVCGIAWMQVNSLGDLARLQGDYRAAATYYKESLELARDMTSKHHQAIVLHNLGHVARRLCDSREAKRCFRESLLLFRELGDIAGTAECIAGLAGTAVDEDPERAARLFECGPEKARGNEENENGERPFSLGCRPSQAKYQPCENGDGGDQ